MGLLKAHVSPIYIQAQLYVCIKLSKIYTRESVKLHQTKIGETLLDLLDDANKDLKRMEKGETIKFLEVTKSSINPIV